jgi:hypothetical protein
VSRSFKVRACVRAYGTSHTKIIKILRYLSVSFLRVREKKSSSVGFHNLTNISLFSLFILYTPSSRTLTAFFKIKETTMIIAKPTISRYRCVLADPSAGASDFFDVLA